MELVKSPDSWLEKKVRLFNFKELNAKEISGRMASIMLSKNGIGLAANQVALDAQIFVMRPIEHEEVTKPFAVINPEILEEFSGIDARCFLHEYDHLQGIEFTDRVSKLKLQMAKKKQKKLMAGVN